MGKFHGKVLPWIEQKNLEYFHEAMAEGDA